MQLLHWRCEAANVGASYYTKNAGERLMAFQLQNRKTVQFFRRHSFAIDALENYWDISFW